VILRVHPRPARLYFITSLFRYFVISCRKSLSPSESALTKKALVTHLESALPKSLDLKSFRIRTYVKGWGEGAERLTRNQRSALPRADEVACWFDATKRPLRKAAATTAGTKLRRRRPSIPIARAGSRLRSGGLRRWRRIWLWH
jgi:hypothetical protein